MSKPFYYTLSFLSFAFLVCTAQKSSNSKTYIVLVTKPPDEIHIDDLKTYHESFLPSSKTTTSDDDYQPIRRLKYSYKHVISGFAAKLTPQALESMKMKPGFISAKEESISRPHTTHSPDFLGLQYGQDGFWKSSNYGDGTIIGVLDTGILPNHPSFDDKGMPPPPKKWKGKCVGHWTHTASTAAGNFVANASVLGNGPGTASGIAPRAHLAMYKVCTGVCRDIDILAAFDAAIGDGVDVISVSLGNTEASPFYKDAIALVSFAAVQNGVLVSSSAGNSGPVGETLSNDAPWLLTVGASTMDRSIKAIAKLGDGQEFDGQSASQNFKKNLKFRKKSWKAQNFTLFC